MWTAIKWITLNLWTLLVKGWRAFLVFDKAAGAFVVTYILRPLARGLGNVVLNAAADTMRAPKTGRRRK
jgi:hypothetical protein